MTTGDFCRIADHLKSPSLRRRRIGIYCSASFRCSCCIGGSLPGDVIFVMNRGDRTSRPRQALIFSFGGRARTSSSCLMTEPFLPGEEWRSHSFSSHPRGRALTWGRQRAELLSPACRRIALTLAKHPVRNCAAGGYYQRLLGAD